MSPFSRVNHAMYGFSTSTCKANYRNLNTISKCLAEELINTAQGSSNSYAIKRKMNLSELLIPTFNKVLKVV